MKVPEGQNAVKVVEEEVKNKRHQPFEPGDMGSSKSSPYNIIDGVQNKSRNDEKSEQCLSSEQIPTSDAEFQCLVDENHEFVSQIISMEEYKLELSPSVDVTCKLEEIGGVAGEENKLEENCESQS